ncbi:restriction endonuclease subunit S [Aeromonas sp. MaB10011B]|uniref:restriction endonuclease subunit S n=1 Tax=Aeromonas TaxID=642 RepID=UPI001B3423BE|nr:MULTISPECIES: restriction endonuclease subunit S [Aeromonas]MBP4067245.1 restriction endonuclease subunit S [Aeromonas sp. MaB10011B]MBP4079289.1 restriction endonuclease subunit S [Aeromonas sp. MrichA-1]
MIGVLATQQQELAGKYRPYPEYKDSGITRLGAIPSHWQPKKLKRMASIENGRDYKHVEATEGFPVIGSGGQFTWSEQYLYSGESVLLGRKGTVDKPLYINGSFWTVDTMFYTKVGKTIPAKFLYYAALTIEFGLYSTNTALPSMTQEDLGNIHFGSPSYGEAENIAAFLDYETSRIDRLIAKQQQLIELLKEKRQAVISHAVTKGLNPDAPMKDSGVEWLGKVPEQWEVVPTKRFFRLVAKPAPENNDFELLSVYTDIGVKPRKELEQRGNKSSTTDGYWLVKKGDIVVNKLLAWMGAVGYSDYSGVTSPAYDILRATRPINSKFYHYLFRADIAQKEFKRWSRGIMEMRLRLYFDELGRILMPFPSKDEQDYIVAYIEKMERQFEHLASKMSEQIALLQERRSALISAAVTGKIDLRGWTQPSNEVAA